MVINVSIFYILSLLSSNYLGMSIPALIEKVLATPVEAVNSVPGSIFLCAFMLLLWCCGVHGQMVTMALTAPITTAAFTANAALVAKGQAPIFHPILQVRSLMLLIRQRKYIFLWKPPKTDMPTLWLWQIHQRTKHISGFPVSANAFH